MHYHLNDCHESQLLPAGLIRGKYASNFDFKVYFLVMYSFLCQENKVRAQADGAAALLRVVSQSVGACLHCPRLNPVVD